MTEVMARYTFGVGGNARPYMREGWSHREADFTWTDGGQSRLLLPLKAADSQVMLEISLNPFLAQPIVRSQRMTICVNGKQIANEVLHGESALGLLVPRDVSAGSAMLDIALNCATSTAPSSIGVSSDDRLLGVAVRELLLYRTEEPIPYVPRLRRPLPVSVAGTEVAVLGMTGLRPADLAACFESLGHDCEFGLVQRAMGAEGAGLLRMGGLPVRRLIEGLDHGFEGVDVRNNLITYLSDPSLSGDPNLREFMVRDIRYETNYHTNMTDRDTTSEQVLEVFHRHLRFLRRKFVEDLSSGHKIFVFQHPAIRSIAQVRPILSLLRRYGRNTLLYATDERDQLPGSVEQLDEDLFHGRIVRPARGGDTLAFDLPSWISICANTYRMWRESGQGG